MSTPITRSSGAITTTGVATSTGPGVLSYAQTSTSGILKLYDGTGTTGVLLASLPVGARQNYDPPVQFRTGLWSVPSSTKGTSAGTVVQATVVHYA